MVDALSPESELQALLARISPKRRKQLEKFRDQERARYEELHRQAREEYERNR